MGNDGCVSSECLVCCGRVRGPPAVRNGRAHMKSVLCVVVVCADPPLCGMAGHT
jgi:hypothetical protein